jgi:hypothetical protein
VVPITKDLISKELVIFATYFFLTKNKFVLYFFEKIKEIHIIDPLTNQLVSDCGAKELS